MGRPYQNILLYYLHRIMGEPHQMRRLVRPSMRRLTGLWIGE